MTISRRTIFALAFLLALSDRWTALVAWIAPYLAHHVTAAHLWTLAEVSGALWMYIAMRLLHAPTREAPDPDDGEELPPPKPWNPRRIAQKTAQSDSLTLN